ncbi:branched-chain amino acid ABC transporter permease [soil metagenome]
MNWIAANIVLIQGTVTTLLLALSIQFPMRVGVFSLAGVGLYGIGGYGAGIAMTRFGWGTWPAAVLGLVAAGLVGYLLGLIVSRLSGLYLAMATIAFDLIVVVVAGNGGTLTGGHTGLYGAAGKFELWQILVIALIVMVLFTLSERGSLARKIEAVQLDPALASSLGINVSRFRHSSFLVSGLVAGLGGALTVLFRTTTSPEAFGFQLVVLSLTVIIVGGSRSWAGVLVGAIIFTWLPVFLAIVGEWRGVVYGLIVAVTAVYFPGGIWGAVVTLRRWWKQRGRGDLPFALPEDELDDDALSIDPLKNASTSQGRTT